MDPSWPQTQRQHQAMTSNWRCTPAWRSHRGGTNAWHGEETQGALTPWRKSDESSAWQTDDSWHLWDSHSGGENGWHGEGASHSETGGSPTAVASQAPSGDSWHWRMSDDSSSSLGDPIGMARFFKPRRRETKETSRSCSGSGGRSGSGGLAPPDGGPCERAVGHADGPLRCEMLVSGGDSDSTSRRFSA